MTIIKLTEENFKREVLDSKIPVLVDFYANWCSPCRMINPIIEEISQEYQKQLKVAKLDIEEFPKLTSQYSVMSVPTLIIFKGGEIVGQVTGVISKKRLKEKIEENL